MQPARRSLSCARPRAEPSGLSPAAPAHPALPHRLRPPPAGRGPLTQVLPTQHGIRPAPLRRLHRARGLRLPRQEDAQAEVQPPAHGTRHLLRAARRRAHVRRKPRLRPLPRGSFRRCLRPSVGHRCQGNHKPGQSVALWREVALALTVLCERFRLGQFSAGSPFTVRSGATPISITSPLGPVSPPPFFFF